MTRCSGGIGRRRLARWRRSSNGRSTTFRTGLVDRICAPTQNADCQRLGWVLAVGPCAIETLETTDTRRENMNRRDFFKTTTAGLTAAGVMMTARERAAAQSFAEQARFARIAGCSWPI